MSKNPAAVALGSMSYEKRVKKHGKRKLNKHLKAISALGVQARIDKRKEQLGA